jgi:hypothetical protein
MRGGRLLKSCFRRLPLITPDKEYERRLHKQQTDDGGPHRDFANEFHKRGSCWKGLAMSTGENSVTCDTDHVDARRWRKDAPPVELADIRPRLSSQMNPYFGQIDIKMYL